MSISVNDFITDKAIEIIGQTDRLLNIARTSLAEIHRQKLYETLSRINAACTDIKTEVEKLDK
ncbi:hypothetical protein GF389_01650 [Candidatus Dojkabacteria bacterium]|nr:hypothetical protein [Candidatus Dojkabacteria bacterium]